MEYDLKLLRDIAPYTFAYGHTLSNYVYNYKLLTAKVNVSGHKDSKKAQEFFERVLRSYLVTKNISHSVKLIEKDMGVKEGELKSPSIPYDKLKEDMKKISSWYEEINVELRETKTYKTFPHVLAEWYEINYPDGNLHEVLTRLANKEIKQSEAVIYVGDNQFMFALTSKNDKFHLFLYRLVDGKYKNDPIYIDNLANAITQFPELVETNKWSR
jgi:hypothetical protein